MIRTQLREMKEKCGMSNKELAERSGVSLPTVNRIMSGQTDVPNYQTVCDLVMAMGGSLDEMAGIHKEAVTLHETSSDLPGSGDQDCSKHFGKLPYRFLRMPFDILNRHKRPSVPAILIFNISIADLL